MATNRIKVSERMLFIWFTIAGLILLFAPQAFSDRVHFTFTRVFQWPLTFGRTVTLAKSPNSQQNDQATRRELQYRNLIANLQRQLEQARMQIEQLSLLRARLPLHGAALIPANIVTATSNSELVINCGSESGIQKGQFILTDSCIIGTVDAVEHTQARIKLFTDPASMIEVDIGRLRIGRLMHGTGNNAAKIPNVPGTHKVAEGDLVYARKKAGLLDSPIIIGTVSQCKPDDQKPLLWDITVKPACSLDALLNVYVLVMNPKKPARL